MKLARLPMEPTEAELARILARLLAEDVRQYPDGAPAEGVAAKPSATSGTRSVRRQTNRIIGGTLHPPHPQETPSADARQA